MGRAKACRRMRALPLHLPCLKHLTFLQRRVTFLLPTAPPQSQLRVKQRLKKTRAPARYMELIAVRKPSEMHGEPQTGTHSSLPPPPMAGPMVPADSGGISRLGTKEMFDKGVGWDQRLGMGAG